MTASGFVLAGGGSTRMGRDKASLAYRGSTLLDYIAGVVQAACGSVALLGDPDRFERFDYPIHRDLVPHCGPMGGIYTALSVTTTDWNLIVACDMPTISVTILRDLVSRALKSKADCVAAATPDGQIQPLCALYHRRTRGELEQALRSNRLKMRELVLELDAEAMQVEASLLANVNTPADWIEFAQHS